MTNFPSRILQWRSSSPTKKAKRVWSPWITSPLKIYEEQVYDVRPESSTSQALPGAPCGQLHHCRLGCLCESLKWTRPPASLRPHLCPGFVNRADPGGYPSYSLNCLLGQCYCRIRRNEDRLKEKALKSKVSVSLVDIRRNFLAE